MTELTNTVLYSVQTTTFHQGRVELTKTEGQSHSEACGGGQLAIAYDQ